VHTLTSRRRGSSSLQPCTRSLSARTAPVPRVVRVLRGELARELAHFHDCVVSGRSADAAGPGPVDMDVLTQMFLKSRIRRMTELRARSSAPDSSRGCTRRQCATWVERSWPFAAAHVRSPLLADDIGGVTAYDSLDELLRGEAVDVEPWTACTSARRCTARRADAVRSRPPHACLCEKPLADSTEESGRKLDG